MLLLLHQVWGASTGAHRQHYVRCLFNVCAQRGRNGRSKVEELDRCICWSFCLPPAVVAVLAASGAFIFPSLSRFDSLCTFVCESSSSPLLPLSHLTSFSFTFFFPFCFWVCHWGQLLVAFLVTFNWPPESFTPSAQIFETFPCLSLSLSFQVSIRCKFDR